MRTTFAILGANGRMGRELSKLYREKYTTQLELVARIDIQEDSPNEPLPRITSLESAPAFDLLIDFSSPKASLEALPHLLNRRAAWVLATTGLSPEDIQQIHSASQTIPILHAANTSLGIALMQKLCVIAAKTLKDWDCEIIEAHHRNKLDAPSGTALAIANAVAAENADFKDFLTHRDHLRQTRKTSEIGISSIRGGTVTGEHTAIWLGPHERLEIKHTAENRILFAQGALYAAQWLVKQPKGYYKMSDCIDL